MPDPEPNSIEARLTQVERELARLREELAIARTDAGAARVLAAGADRDVAEVRAELRAHTQALNALRENQLELGESLSELHQSQLQMQAEMRAGFGTVQTGMARITTLIEDLAERNDLG